ncbi:MAG: SDR family NAD(P)-dependent oxidoreductase [Chloroflexi bacterium AL-W]|nr:SDR family NAD(P)-dependent oxidoreductase [Chloroflexi bacterium AL-N1]NOK68506.1 SDR family NAD(P)-dependent oxidoreductase [Chloroflexi bacterium AL-N10]NOK74152.1 SDR family NAD(P)-dependent oxidoreductase [Chloroflexi bacterium AL-N5]NOK83119.1 SDR family NAD(P)-dependent oxidoreductase [Chloroflexi bacterium AL-W]NOK90642.1 SDR family NAD(P)-dependent oxidoreductase [Chloroflexi bacterium AL-N15]
MQHVVITGVSTGIGWGATKVLIERGFHVFGSVRKQADADRLSAEFGTNFTPLLFDVVDQAAVQKAADQVHAHLNGQTLSGLVNNAGIAVPGPLMHLAVDQYRHQLEINLVGPLIVTQAFLPLLGAERGFKGTPGRIVNISSVGGRVAAPFVGAYTASKHGLEGLSESWRRELMIYGIDVIIVGPGSVATPIWDKANNEDITPFEGTDYIKPLQKFRTYATRSGKKGLASERVGEVIWKALSEPKPRVRYPIVPQHFFNWTLPMLLPRRMVDRFLASQFGLKRK